MALYFPINYRRGGVDDHTNALHRGISSTTAVCELFLFAAFEYCSLLLWNYLYFFSDYHGRMRRYLEEYLANFCTREII